MKEGGPGAGRVFQALCIRDRSPAGARGQRVCHTCRSLCSVCVWTAVFRSVPRERNSPDVVWQAGQVRQRGFVLSQVNSGQRRRDQGSSPIVVSVLRQRSDCTGLAHPDTRISTRQSRMGACPDTAIEAGDHRRQRGSRHREGTPAPPGPGFHLCPREGAWAIHSRSTWGLQRALVDVTVGALTGDPRCVVI